MNINYKQPQFELFPANSATLEDINKPRFLLANLTLSVESLVIFTILGIMVALFFGIFFFFFFFGLYCFFFFFFGGGGSAESIPRPRHWMSGSPRPGMSA